MRPQMRTYLTCHPRHIKERGSQLAGTIVKDKKRGVHHTINSVAQALYKSAVTMPQFCRSALLIARSICEELFWTDEQLSGKLQDELADIVTSNFVITWTEEFKRGAGLDFERLAAQKEDDRFKQSNPRPDDSAFEDLYLEEMDITNCQSDDIEQIAALPESDHTPTQHNAVLSEDGLYREEKLHSVSILLGDLYSMGFIDAYVMEICILYCVNNACHSVDLWCLHAVLDRAASHLAPKFDLDFLRTCRYKLVLSNATREADEMIRLLTLIDHIIDYDIAAPNNASGSHYARRACHRWDSAIVGKISLEN
ncbi:hypothetical protein C0991_010992 [Blastosporella zonata]|nr:hypothetical protein C0991_010992 [Blastosporella zonata]